MPFADTDISILNVEKAPVDDRIREKIFWENTADLLHIEV